MCDLALNQSVVNRAEASAPHRFLAWRRRLTSQLRRLGSAEVVAVLADELSGDGVAQPASHPERGSPVTTATSEAVLVATAATSSLPG